MQLGCLPGITLSVSDRLDGATQASCWRLPIVATCKRSLSITPCEDVYYVVFEEIQKGIFTPKISTTPFRWEVRS